MTTEQRLYEKYLKYQSKEWIADIIGWENFNEPNAKVSIRVNFKIGMCLEFTGLKEMDWNGMVLG